MRSRRLLPLVAAGALGLAACNPFSAPTREEARAVVTAEQAAQVRIITSTDFFLTSTGGSGEQADVDFESADTTVVEPRFDRTFDIRETRRFFIRVEPTDTASVVATLEVFIDGESLGRLSGDLQEGPLEDVFVSAEI